MPRGQTDIPQAGAALRIKITIPKAAFAAGADEYIGAALHKHSPELSASELAKVRERTPVRFGALRESASAKAYPSKNSRALIKLWYDDEPQLFEWGRVYAPYQEELPMGLQTYTPQKAHMLYRVSTDDQGDITEWAYHVAQTALDEWTALAQAEADADAIADAVD